MSKQESREVELDGIENAVLRGEVRSVDDAVVKVEESEIGAVRVMVLSGDSLVRLGVDLPVGEAEELRDELAALLEE